MDPAPLVLPPDATVGEGLEQLRQFEGDPADCEFVCDSQRRLLGVVGIARLVRAALRGSLESVMEPPEYTVTALASIASMARHEGWERFHVLPVVERENRLVGALHRGVLKRELAGGVAMSEPPLATGAAGAYWATLTALTEGVVRALPPVTPVGKIRRNDER